MVLLLLLGCSGNGGSGIDVNTSTFGDSLDAKVVAGDVRVSLALTVSGEDQIDGTYEMQATGGACPADRGSMAMNRVP